MEDKFTKNNKGVYYESHTDKNGKEHTSFYDTDPRANPEHASIHINWNSETGKGEIVDTTTGEKVTTDIDCFLTTACMRHYKGGFDDDCEELRTLRWFRNNFVSKNDIDYYYEVAPIIVSSIESIDNNQKIYDYLYENVIFKCVDAIKNGEYEYAYNKYKHSVIVLSRIFNENIKSKKIVRKI